MTDLPAVYLPVLSDEGVLTIYRGREKLCEFRMETEAMGYLAFRCGDVIQRRALVGASFCYTLHADEL